jgi:hypothetical protein
LRNGNETTSFLTGLEGKPAQSQVSQHSHDVTLVSLPPFTLPPITVPSLVAPSLRRRGVYIPDIPDGSTVVAKLSVRHRFEPGFGRGIAAASPRSRR